MGYVVLAESGPAASQLHAVLSQVPGTTLLAVPAISAAEDLATRREAHVLVIGPSVPADAALESAARIAEAETGTSVVILAQRMTTELLRLAMRAGVRDVLSVSDPDAEIAASVRTAHEAAGLRRAERVETARDGQRAKRARTISVFSTKGGVGKSTLATNLGAHLARRGHKTILVDLDLQFGDVGVMLHLAPERTAFDAAGAADRLDAEMLSGFLATHSCGLRALLAPVRPEEAESVTTPRLTRVLDLLRDMADYVVIDTAAAFNETVLTALDHSDEILAVATMDVPSIKNTRISLHKLRQLGYADGRVRLVLNRADSKVNLRLPDVERALEASVAARIPSDRLVPRSVNMGVPIVLDQPRSSVAKAVVALADSIGYDARKVTSDVA